MVALPIDTAKFTGIICAVAPTPRIANRETGQVRVDRDTGQTVYQVGLCLMSGRSADVVTVNVPGEPSGVQNGVPRSGPGPGGHAVGERGAARRLVPRHRDQAPHGSGSLVPVRLFDDGIREGDRAVIALAAPNSAGSASSSCTLVVVAVLVSGLLLAGPALRRRYPVVWWVCLGFPVACIRVARTWRPLMAGCGLAVSRKAALMVVSGLVGNGASPPQPRVPHRGLIRPTRGGFWFLIRLLPGQVPEDFVKRLLPWRTTGERMPCA